MIERIMKKTIFGEHGKDLNRELSECMSRELISLSSFSSSSSSSSSSSLSRKSVVC